MYKDSERSEPLVPHLMSMTPGRHGDGHRGVGPGMSDDSCAKPAIAVDAGRAPQAEVAS